MKNIIQIGIIQDDGRNYTTQIVALTSDGKVYRTSQFSKPDWQEIPGIPEEQIGDVVF